MANQIELTVLSEKPHSGEVLRPLLIDFEHTKQIHVNIKTIPWRNGYKEILNSAVYGQGPDVSEVGTTWISSLASMNALRDYNSTEIEEMGGEGSFLAQIWQSGLLPGDPRVWAIPWTVFTPLLYYRKIWLAKVGIDDPAAAIESIPSFEDTLERLKAAGASYPWVPYILRSSRIVHEIVPWIWGAGGDLVSPSEKKVTFNEEAALKGLNAYYSLHRFIPSTLPLDGNGDEMFLKGETPLIISGPWLALDHLTNDPVLMQRVGICKVPGSPYLGGSSLVIWKHGRQVEASLDLVHYLTGMQVKIPVSPHADSLPARIYTLTQQEAESELNRVMLRSLASGRAFRPMRLWSMIEENLTSALARIWADLLDNPSLDVDSVLYKHLDGLATRMNNTLAG